MANNYEGIVVHRRRIFGVSLLLTIVIGAGLLAVAFCQRQNIEDWWVLRNYQPSVAVANLSSESSLTSKAQRIFYVNKPAILGTKEFNKACPANGEQTIVLGCYHGEQRGIYIYKVSDDRLEGVMQVTAAHEMLHAAYDRLSSNERILVDKMLESYYHDGLDDQRIIDTIEAYKKSEPKDVVNEMHSIFGSEIANLPSDLENYYSRYFIDRHKVAAYAAAYQGEFTSRQKRVEAYDKQLTKLASVITTAQDQLNAEEADLTDQRSVIDRSNSTNNVSAYNAMVNRYNARVADYNQQLKQLKANISLYNELVDQRNSIALEVQSLAKAMDSHALKEL